MEVMEMKEQAMKKRWRVVSNYLVSDPVVFDSLQRLQDILKSIGVNTDVFQEDDEDGRRILRSRAYTKPGVGLIIEAVHPDFDEEAWLRNPSWETIAEALGEEEEGEEE